MDIEVKDFRLDAGVVADCIYGNFPHLTTSIGVQIGKAVRAEFERFLVEYNEFLMVNAMPFYRIDAYFSEETLHILEVNAAFVDGWGTALNLARASGIKINPQKLVFPKYFATLEKAYLPELEVLVAELKEMGKEHQIVPYQVPLPRPLYVYGRIEGSATEKIMPVDGLYLDDKRHLANFSLVWRSKFVKILRHFTSEADSWEDIPETAVLKFCDKAGQESRQARTSVLIGKPSGKAKFLRSCYDAETLLAQEFVPPSVHELGNMQLILLTTGNALVTGYTQFSQKKIINDNSVHGPLCIE